jgi:hypothetical protein
MVRQKSLKNVLIHDGSFSIFDWFVGPYQVVDYILMLFCVDNKNNN